MLDPAFLTACGPWVHAETTAAVIAQESGGNPFAIGTPGGPIYANSVEEAQALLFNAMRRYKSVDIGIMQINSRWLAKLPIQPVELFDPCTNIKIGTSILAANFESAVPNSKTPLEALIRALSAYNSGSQTAALGYAYSVISRPLDGTTKAVFKVHLPAPSPTPKQPQQQAGTVFYPTSRPGRGSIFFKSS
ncbi:transglycosylase SLT domain-containing protein (plasmid) [Dyella sp. BiH032]|uniref:transglycosylase SLT domain-containing protein n=1 Tax=Dyella sp. BiH032 TaxID=3075430 RepID=UPI002892CA4B|nr:transglycosylase SLT domain-containing protein [Dyella sp. BiH032]WNL48574.1 transglycosylase SLT domain-containing protein [Dyella sp. BiH032]